MANGDVKVREVRLLESYSTAYNRFMESTIQMTYRFRNLFAQKDDQARDLEHKIKDHLNIAQQKLAHAKADYEASVKRGGGMDGQELAHREQALEKYKALYKKAQMQGLLAPVLLWVPFIRQGLPGPSICLQHSFY